MCVGDLVDARAVSVPLDGVPERDVVERRGEARVPNRDVLDPQLRVDHRGRDCGIRRRGVGG